MWNRQRIDSEHALKEKYGLRNLRELWKATTEVSTIRKNVREVLSGRATERVGTSIIGRLSRYGIVRDTATLDDLLSVNPEAILERRLQSVVFKKGLSKSMKQARQLITHGFIAVSGRRVSAPGYLVPRIEEEAIAYYKPFNIDHSNTEAATVPAAGAAPTAKAEAPAAKQVQAEQPKGE